MVHWLKYIHTRILTSIVFALFNTDCHKSNLRLSCETCCFS